MRRWMKCGVWIFPVPLGVCKWLMDYSWALGTPNRRIHDISHSRPHNCSSMRLNCDYSVLLPYYYARDSLHQTVRAKTVRLTPPSSWLSASTDPSNSIIRILFMIPVYAASSFLELWFYWHAVYFQVISDCYEAFAIASFFALLCHYVAPNLHEQKQYFRTIQPKGWVLPLSWFKKCCGGERGCWRTPRSGLTWFNIIWTGIYQYCFIRVAMTVTAVVTQYFGKYCESSNSPVFAHIWVGFPFL